MRDQNFIQAPEIDRAAAVLKRGGLVAFPTETVYGLGADARSPEALRRLYKVKGRPLAHPVIVHLGEVSWLERWARPDPRALALAQRFWPGPLTLILRRHPDTPDEVTGGQETVGVRMPNHPLALELLRAFGGGIAAPSANRFGRVSPTTAAHVRGDLGSDVDVILDGGPCEVGVESTIVDLSGREARVLRPGAVTESELKAVLKKVGSPEAKAGGVRAPGTLKSHYAPNAPVELVEAAKLNQALQTLLEQGASVAVWSREKPSLEAEYQWIPAPSEPVPFTKSLYATLRELDGPGVTHIVIEHPPDGEAWRAALDRLRRASHRE